MTLMIYHNKDDFHFHEQAKVSFITTPNFASDISMGLPPFVC